MVVVVVVILVAIGWEPGMLLIILQYTGQPYNKEGSRLEYPQKFVMPEWPAGV